MFEYQTLFDARGALYNRANLLFPEARSEEARVILRHLELRVGARWLDVSAGGGYLSVRAAAQGLPRARFDCDGSLPFVRSAGDGRAACVSRAETLPFPEGAAEGAACLAALHHSEDPAGLCRELLRVTAPGHRVAVGDVVAGSAASRFLNGFVHRHTESGHRGRFYPTDALAGFLRTAAGGPVRDERVEVLWTLPSRTDSIVFCRNLFGLEPSATDRAIAEALDGLGARRSPDAFRIPWTMHFASAART